MRNIQLLGNSLFRQFPFASESFRASTRRVTIRILKKIIITNDATVLAKSGERGFTPIVAGIRHERLAQELANELNDAGGIKLYRSYAAKYPEWLLRKVLAEVEAMPTERINKSRAALFNYLVQHYAKGATENPGY